MSSNLALSKDSFFVSQKTTWFNQGKPVSICHEYPNNLRVTKSKENGKWQVNSIGFPSIDLYERKARCVGLRKTHGLVLDEYAVKCIKELPATLKKVVQPSLETLIDMATKAIKR